jgi:hypothetical protein
MSVGMLITVLLIVMFAVFLIAAVATRAPVKRAVAALAGGWIGAFIGSGLDAIGVQLGLWVYVVGSRWHAPWPIYIAAGFEQAAIAMVYCRVRGLLGIVGRMGFVAIVAAVLVVQDYAAGLSGPKIQQIAPGILPAIGDFVVWTVVTSITLIVATLREGAAATLTAEAR